MIAKDNETIVNFQCLCLRMVHYMMPLNRRVLVIIALLCPLFCLPGAAVPAAGKKNAQKKPPPINLGGAAQDVTMSVPDPKMPGGKLLYYLRAVSASGQSEPDGFHGTMTKIWARLYQKGVPSAVLTAPRAQGGSTKKSVVVTGMGGIVMKSLTQPGTILTADTVVWYASLNKIVATGHVFYRDGKTGATLTGPVMNGDTKLKSVSLTSGVHARMSF